MYSGANAVLAMAKQAKGRTIRDVSLLPNRSNNRHMHNDETLTIEFTDGATLALEIGSNAGNLASDDDNFDARILSLSFCARFEP